MSEQTELLREIRDLLLVVAEPALAKRDEALREKLKQIAGKSAAKHRSILLMDGTRSQTSIKSEAKIDQGDLSRLIKALREGGLLGKDEKAQPKLTLVIPPNFFKE